MWETSFNSLQMAFSLLLHFVDRVWSRYYGLRTPTTLPSRNSTSRCNIVFIHISVKICWIFVWFSDLKINSKMLHFPSDHILLFCHYDHLPMFIFIRAKYRLKDRIHLRYRSHERTSRYLHQYEHHWSLKK